MELADSNFGAQGRSNSSRPLAQVQTKADILDVNFGATGVEETILLPQAIQAVMNTTVDICHCISIAVSQRL